MLKMLLMLFQQLHPVFSFIFPQYPHGGVHVVHLASGAAAHLGHAKVVTGSGHCGYYSVILKQTNIVVLVMSYCCEGVFVSLSPLPPLPPRTC